MPRKFRIFPHKGQAELVAAAMLEPDYEPGLLPEIVARLSKIDHIEKYNEAIIRRDDIDTALGYPMEATLHAPSLERHPGTKERGIRVKSVHTARTNELIDIETLLGPEDMDNLNENWLPEEEEE